MLNATNVFVPTHWPVVHNSTSFQTRRSCCCSPRSGPRRLYRDDAEEADERCGRTHGRLRRHRQATEEATASQPPHEMAGLKGRGRREARPGDGWREKGRGEGADGRRGRSAQRSQGSARRRGTKGAKPRMAAAQLRQGPLAPRDGDHSSPSQRHPGRRGGARPTRRRNGDCSGCRSHGQACAGQSVRRRGAGTRACGATSGGQPRTESGEESVRRADGEHPGAERRAWGRAPRNLPAGRTSGQSLTCSEGSVGAASVRGRRPSRRHGPQRKNSGQFKESGDSAPARVAPPRGPTQDQAISRPQGKPTPME